MGSNNRRRRPRRRREEPTNKAPKPTAASRSDEEQPPARDEATPAVHEDVPDHVLELILLRLDSSVSLVRAASACKLWLRVVADAGFLARFRLRVPLVLGHYHNFVHPRPAFAPWSPPTLRESSTPFSLDFVPEFSGTWEAVDSRDGLLLLRNDEWGRTSDPDLAICDPKTRRYQPITLPAGDNLSSSRRNLLGMFLLRGGATGARHGGELSASMSNFRVLVVVLRGHMLDRGRGVPGARVYHGSKRCWREVRCPWTGNIDVPAVAASFYFAGRANGRLYWGIRGFRAAALVLDEATAGVSLEPLPACMQGWSEAQCFRVVGGEDNGTLRALRLEKDGLRVFRRLEGGGGEWVHERLVRLPKYDHGFVGTAIIFAAHERYALVRPQHHWERFSVDLKTMAVKPVPVRSTNVLYQGPGYPYELPWPPILKP
ncbi:unnamed protein product [Urochloa humidicola]